MVDSDVQLLSPSAGGKYSAYYHLHNGHSLDDRMLIP